MSRGRVYLVGAGPGDPDLVTVKGRRLLETADAVLYDHLAPDALLELAPNAERVYVGKKKSEHAYSQEEICAMLIERARRGLTVVRLKGGDPFIFGRGGEELAYLTERGIPVEVVPGITAALGCAAAAGLSLTHRDHAQALTLVTAEGKAGEPALDWPALARPGQMLAIYMGVAAAGRIARRLLDGGLSAETPVAVVENGTLPEQRVAAGTLGRLEQLVAASGTAGPAIIFVGEAARAAHGAAEPQPLALAV